MRIKTLSFSVEYYDSVFDLVRELQLFEAMVNQYRSIDSLKMNQIAKNIIETNKEKGGQLLLASMDNEIVGFISYYVEDEILNSSKHVYVSDLVVSEKHRGKGIARQLMVKAEEFARSEGLTIVRVAVLANSSSKDFYHKIGYEDETVELVKEL